MDTTQAKTVPLAWEFDGQGEWSSPSDLCSDGEALSRYSIQVCDNGTFDVSGSCAELGLSGPKEQTLPTLAEAKKVCEDREQIVTRDGY